MTGETCIILCSLFSHRHAVSIITWRRWTTKRQKLYRTS